MINFTKIFAQIIINLFSLSFPIFIYLQMRMQNPQLIAQLSRGPNNMNPQQQQQQQQMGGYGGQQNRFQ